MKKILIVTPTIRNGGGVIRALQNMLSMLPIGKYAIDVLPMGYSDSNNIKLSNCKLLDDNFILTSITAIYSQTFNYKHRKLLKITKGFLFILGKLNLRFIFENFLFSHVAAKYKDYDIVIAYQEGLCTRFVQYIESKLHIAWIHCDYSEYTTPSEIDVHMYSKFQRIVCVSKFTLQKFQQMYPSLKEKSIYIYNLLDKSFIKKSANAFIPKELNQNNKFKIISIGRLDPIKQFHLIPNIIAQMQSLGALNFKWILIGGEQDSEQYKLIMSEVKRFNIDNQVFSYLGPQYNPYPYIKNSDVLVSTSLSEACPFVVNEARVLGIPVISNNYPSISEFIKDGISGKISSIEKIAIILTKLITDANEHDKLKIGMKKNDYNNDSIINEIINLLDYESTI